MAESAGRNLPRPAALRGRTAAHGDPRGRVEGDRPPLELVVMLNSRLLAEALAAALSAGGAMRCAIGSLGEEGGEEHAASAAEKVVVLLELTPGDAAQEHVLKQVKSRFPEGRIIVLAAGSSPAAEVDALVRGVQGIFPMGAGLASLKKAIAAVSSGEVWADREITGLAISHLTASPAKKPEKGERVLTRREREILALVAAGLKNRQIAEQLFIAEQTVKVHLNRIFQKIGAVDRLQAALYAIHHQVVPQRIFPRTEPAS